MSSGSESDEDFVPGEPEQLSEEESADDETEQQFEKEQEVKSQKRKTNQKTKTTKKRKTRNDVKEVVEPKDESEDEEEKTLDPEAEKKRQDDLWAMFLDGTDTKPRPKSQTQDNEAKTKEEPSKDKNVHKKEKSNDLKEKERRIFEFAGETIVVENNVIKEKIPTASAASKPLVSTSRKPGGGLSSVLGQLNKSNKLSTLEKSKLDWETFKQKEGIQEEIQNYNKGKNGYLDRQDFLQRADQKQYEIERELRMSRRGNR